MYEAHLRSLLSPLGIYDLEEHSASGAAVCALGTGLDTVSRRLEEIEREALTATAEGEGLARREALLAQREAQLKEEQAAFEAAKAQGETGKKKLLDNNDPDFVNPKEKLYDKFPLTVHQMDIIIGVLFALILLFLVLGFTHTSFFGLFGG